MVEFRYYLSNAKRECCNRKFNYFLGCISIFIVVLVAAVCFTVIAKAPVVFLQQAETASGQYDFALSSSMPNYLFVNYTAVSISTSTPEVSSLSYHAPRLELAATLYGSDCVERTRQLGYDPEDPAWKYRTVPNTSFAPSPPSPGLPLLCEDRSLSRTLLTLTLIDTERERRMAFGRQWPHARLAEGEVVLGRAAAKSLGLSAGSLAYVAVQLNSEEAPLVTSLLTAALAAAQRLVNASGEQGVLRGLQALARVAYVPVRVRAVEAGAGGKLGADAQDFIFAELATTGPLLLRHLHPALASTRVPDVLRSVGAQADAASVASLAGACFAARSVSQWCGGVDMAQLATTVFACLPPPRTAVYLDSSYDNVQKVAAVNSHIDTLHSFPLSLLPPSL
jgi:hypothetical protein